MGLKRETREQWGAKPPKNRRYVTASTAKTGGVAVHYPGSEGSMAHLTHSQCQATMRGWQTYHMGRGSNDLEYGSVICQHGRWMEARTEFDNWLVRVGSNGTAAANDRHTSVQLMLGTTDRITDEQKAWLAEAIATLRAHGWGLDVKGHRDFVGTPCPGSSIYNALPEIRRMADNWNEEDDMPSADEVAKAVWAHEIDGRPARWYQRQAHRIARKWLGPSGDPAAPSRQATILGEVRALGRKVDALAEQLEKGVAATAVRSVKPEPEDDGVDDE